MLIWSAPENIGKRLVPGTSNSNCASTSSGVMGWLQETAEMGGAVEGWTVVQRGGFHLSFDLELYAS